MSGVIWVVYGKSLINPVICMTFISGMLCFFEICVTELSLILMNFAYFVTV